MGHADSRFSPMIPPFWDESMREEEEEEDEVYVSLVDYRRTMCS